MLYLLKIGVSGYKMLPEGFSIDFTTKARVGENDEIENDSEVFEIAPNLYSFNIMALTGSNSSGKSTVLTLIFKVISLMKTGRWAFRNRDFGSDKIKLHIEFYLDGVIYIYDSIILKSRAENDFEIKNAFCSIVEERVRFALYKPSVGRRYLTELEFQSDHNATGLEDTSVLVFLCKSALLGYYVGPFSSTDVSVSRNFFDILGVYSPNLTTQLIQLLDESIEWIKPISSDTVSFKRVGRQEVVITKQELLNQLSNGTIKGIELYVRIITLLKYGGIMLVDEIENCFHKNLVNNVLYLLMDKTLNKKDAQIIFSTHYVEILDTLSRRDNIFVLHKKDSRIDISNLYENYNIRTEISKSKQFNKNAFNTLLNYERLMSVKRMIKHEILDND